jgi:ATP-dependent Lon protease
MNSQLAVKAVQQDAVLSDLNEELFHLVAIDISPERDGDIVWTASIEQLVAQGANVNYANKHNGKTLLQYAIERRLRGVATLLVTHGAEFNKPLNTGRSSILELAGNVLPDLVPFLLEQGADVMMLMEGGETAGEACLRQLHFHGRDDLQDLVTEYLHKATMIISSNEPMTFHSTLGDWSVLRREIERESNAHRKHYLEILDESGPARKHAANPDLEALSALRDRFPNFTAVIEELENQVILFSLSKFRSFTIEPILMVGEAGVGKTRFVIEAAKALGLEFRNIGCGTVTAGWVLGGSSTSWNEGKPGQVHIQLRDGKTMNPLIMLDEIDKMAGDSRFDPYGPLYPLLEKHSARKFVDESIGFPIDCSHINWIATANTLETIPPAIVSRFTIIEVKKPTLEQMQAVTRSIYRDLLEENKETWGSRFAPEISQEVVDSLASEPPRQIRAKLRRGFAKAARSRKAETYHLIPDDLYDTVAPRPSFCFL